MKVAKLFFLCLLLCGKTGFSQSPEDQIRVDSYGQQWLNIVSEKSPHQIKMVKEMLSSFLTSHERTAFFVTVPHSSFEKELQQEGFELYTTTPKHREWIYKNNSPIPPALSGNAGAVGYIIHDGRVLLIEDKSRPGAFECPGGGMEVGEYSDDAVLREVREEVGLETEIIQLVGNSQRVYKTRYGLVNNHGYFYLLKLKNPNQAIPKIDPKEVLQAKWISLDEVDQQELSSITRLILDHLRGRIVFDHDSKRRVHLHELSKESKAFLLNQGLEIKNKI